MRITHKTIHHDAADWAARVASNSGVVSQTTLSLVSDFCAAIDKAGIRDKFYRLNLLCGTGLNACLVPLYRGPSRNGTQYGNTTDTNNGPFVSGDYVETGASGGLQGNGSSKYLNTGLAMNHTTPRDIHLAAVVGNLTNNNAGMIGADTDGDGQSPRFYQSIVSFNAASRVNVFYNIGTNFRQADKTLTYSGTNSYIGSGNSSGNAFYVAGASVATALETGSGTNSRTYPIYVFAHNARNLATPVYIANARIVAYSAGLYLSSAQISSYEAALTAFRTAMGRQ